MKYTKIINAITKFIDGNECDNGVIRSELKELLELFRYESKYSKIADTTDLKIHYERAQSIVNCNHC